MIAQIGEMGVWLRPAPAAKILGVSLSTLRNKARLWGIRVRTMPRTRGRRFHIEDVQRVATEAAQHMNEQILFAPCGRGRDGVQISANKKPRTDWRSVRGLVRVGTDGGGETPVGAWGSLW